MRSPPAFPFAAYGFAAVAVALMPNDDLVCAGNLADGNGNLILRRISGVNGTPIESWGNGFGFQTIDLQPSANAAREINLRPAASILRPAAAARTTHPTAHR